MDPIVPQDYNGVAGKLSPGGGAACKVRLIWELIKLRKIQRNMEGNIPLGSGRCA